MLQYLVQNALLQGGKSNQHLSRRMTKNTYFGKIQSLFTVDHDVLQDLYVVWDDFKAISKPKNSWRLQMYENKNRYLETETGAPNRKQVLQNGNGYTKTETGTWQTKSRVTTK
jgi:hypothetical protein